MATLNLIGEIQRINPRKNLPNFGRDHLVGLVLLRPGAYLLPNDVAEKSRDSE